VSERVEQLKQMQQQLADISSKLSSLLNVTDLEKKLSEIIENAEGKREGNYIVLNEQYWREVANRMEQYYKQLQQQRKETSRPKSTTTGSYRSTRTIVERKEPVYRVIEEHYELIKDACTAILHNIIGIQSVMPASETATDVYRFCLGTRHLANALRGLLDIIAYERLKIVEESEIVGGE